MTVHRIRLGDVAWIRASIVDPTHQHLRELPHVNAENIVPLTGELLRVQSAAKDGMESGKYQFDAGDVLYSKLRPYLRKAAIPEFAGLCSADMYPLKTDRSRLLPSYLRLLLVSDQFNLYAGEASARSRMPKLNRDQLFAYELFLPALDRQRAIGNAVAGQLAEVEAARQAAQRQARDIALLRIRLLNEMLATLDGVPCKVLGDYAPTTSGTTPPRGAKRYWEPAEIPWVKTGEVAFAPITTTEEAVSQAALAECSLSLLPPKTVLVAMYGQGKTRGQSAILEVAATTNQACLAILPNDTWETEFLYYWLVASYQDLRDLSEDRGGNQANLNGALLKALEVPAPDRAQQLQVVRRIKAALHEMDALATAGRSTLIELELLPQRLLAQAFES